MAPPRALGCDGVGDRDDGLASLMAASYTGHEGGAGVDAWAPDAAGFEVEHVDLDARAAHEDLAARRPPARPHERHVTPP